MDTTEPMEHQPDALRLADALCARLCHDLSSPLGTLTGALEMMADDASALEDAMPIATETATAMVGRLRLLRAAWAGDCGPLSVAQLAALAAGLPPRVSVELGALRGGPFDGPLARTLLNLLLLGAEALPRGGVVTLADGDGNDIVLTVAGKAAAWPAELAQALVEPGSVSLDSPRAIQLPVTVMLARAAGRQLALVPAPAGADTPPSLRLTSS